MGSCLSTHERGYEAMVVPEVEVLISQAEEKHPFAQLPVELMYETLTEYDFKGTITKGQFARFLRKIAVDTEMWGENLQLFVDAISGPEGNVNLKTLLVSVVLLGTGGFQNKLNCLLKGFSGGEVSERGLARILEVSVEVATGVLPALCRDNVDADRLNVYIQKLRRAKKHYIEGVFNLLRTKKVRCLDELLKLMNRRPELQKICWSNGIRVMLIECDFYRRGLVRENPFVKKKATFCELVYPVRRRVNSCFDCDGVALLKRTNFRRVVSLYAQNDLLLESRKPTSSFMGITPVKQRHGRKRSDTLRMEYNQVT